MTRRVILLVLLLFWMPIIARAQVTLSGNEDLSTIGSASTTHDATFTVDGCSDPLVLNFSGGASISLTATWDPGGGSEETLTNNAGASIDGGISALATFYSTTIAAATDTMRVTGGNQTLIQGNFELCNVDFSSGFVDQDEESGTGTGTADLTLTTAVGDFVLFCAHSDGNGADPGAFTQTQGTEVEEILTLGVSGTHNRMSCSYLTADDTSEVVGYDWTESKVFAHVAVVLTPVAGSSISIKFLTIQQGVN